MTLTIIWTVLFGFWLLIMAVVHWPQRKVRMDVSATASPPPTSWLVAFDRQGREVDRCSLEIRPGKINTVLVPKGGSYRIETVTGPINGTVTASLTPPRKCMDDESWKL